MTLSSLAQAAVFLLNFALAFYASLALMRILLSPSSVSLFTLHPLLAIGALTLTIRATLSFPRYQSLGPAPTLARHIDSHGNFQFLSGLALSTSVYVIYSMKDQHWQTSHGKLGITTWAVMTLGQLLPACIWSGKRYRAIHTVVGTVASVLLFATHGLGLYKKTMNVEKERDFVWWGMAASLLIGAGSVAVLGAAALLRSHQGQTSKSSKE
ncbi:uncharacterized protein BJ171DRAFT_502909 [Polychytrium aggregatum]|uniref:uncharacterized protein n=1 Tax=Polychytrium aggregatum TaxID=110093 RepID=UPI0022FDEF0E|nr:uncharacterized protein BJ171DRAFT_502909 [Polychytrium aggregatum]KAI9205078.1 hypothetical protein BJ171DRAFT_502909 [Polychytrium aggregatum]